MAIRRFTVPVAVDDQGDAEAYSPRLSGRLLSIRYVKDNYDNGVDFVITAETSGQTLWAEENVNASATRRPRAPTHSTAGVAALYAGDGEPVLAPIALAGERIKIVVAEGGDETSGIFHFTVDE
jgi:hypothetical protein